MLLVRSVYRFRRLYFFYPQNSNTKPCIRDMSLASPITFFQSTRLKHRTLLKRFKSNSTMNNMLVYFFRFSTLCFNTAKIVLTRTLLMYPKKKRTLLMYPKKKRTLLYNYYFFDINNYYF